MINPFDQAISFEEKALQVFEYQKANNEIFKRFCEALVVTDVSSVDDIPLLPIQAFKDAKVLTDHSTFNTQHSTLLFQSSGTSRMARSRHFVADPSIYRASILEGMNYFYDLDDYVILAYTPGYADNPHSSLVWMLNCLIDNDNSGLSRFLPLGKGIDGKVLDEIRESGKKLILFGAAFGLLDLIEMKTLNLPEDSIIMETGGMKTHRREMTKMDLHEKLSHGFRIPKQSIHSEYGMTELLSQAYSRGSLWFECVPWMQVSIRNPQNPMEVLPVGEEGLIGVMDLANLYSCSFILTGDKGIQNASGEFQVLGRWNPINLRGCNFLIDDE